MKPLPTFEEVLSRFPALAQIGERARLRRIPFVQQLTANDCGIACLAMVLRLHGKSVSVEELRALAVSGRDGTNAQTLIDAGRWHGLRGRAVSLELGQLKFLDRGSILHWDFQHFVVFDRLAKRGVWVVDPGVGRRLIATEQFGKRFTGVAVLFEPTDDFQRNRKPATGLIRYLRQVVRERGFLPHIIVTSVLVQVLGLAAPLLNRLLIDTVVPQRDYHLLAVLAIGFVFVNLFQSWTSIVRSYLFLYLRTRLNARMTLGFLDHLLDLPFDFFQRRTIGDLLVRMSSNSSVREMLTGSVLSAILDGTMALSYLVLLIAIDGPIAAVSCGLALVQIGVFLFTRHRQRQLLAEGLDVQAKSQGYLVEVLGSVETLKAVGAERRAADRWSALFGAELNVSLKRGRLDAMIEAIGGVVRTGSTMLLLGVGTVRVLSGALTLGEMLAINAVAAGFLGPLLSLVSTATGLQLLFVYLERLNDVLDTPGERDREGVQPLSAISGDLTVEDVSFRYAPILPDVVRHVSIHVRAGEFVALVGRSGSGKSTLARLLVGLYHPSEGRVCYDGHDVARLDLTALRQQIGVVTQQARLFGGTIRSNIALSDPAAPLDKVVAAATQAEIHADISSFPMGYDTILIDNGASLSGGQQQRVSLARALVASPRILVLDEATSQLDAATERAVQQNLSQLKCTRVVIAHRLSTIRHADRILVMDNGRIVEEGRHDELVARGGAYARLVSAQMAGEAPATSL